MEASRNINAAGGFLRALRAGARRPGGQGVAVPPEHLPVAAVLVELSAEDNQPVGELMERLGLDFSVMRDTLSNLRDLKLVVIEAADGGDRVRLTETGRVVAERQRGD